MNFSFVILHYNALKDTAECVESIQKFSGKNSQIVIVDNQSPDGSGEDLQKKYAGNSRVTVLRNSKNEGFARGNNVGFLYAKEHQNPDFIVLLNNDTLLLQENFDALVKQEFLASKFAVLGPLVENPGKIFDSNPISKSLPSVAFVKKYILKNRVKLALNFLHLDLLYEFVVRNLFQKKRREKNLYLSRHENVVLHGCFWIFSKKYFSKFDGLNPRTFLFQEERLLFLRLRQNGLKSVYSPEIKIFHKEDVATNSVFKKNFLRRRFLYRQYIASGKILLDELQAALLK